MPKYRVIELQKSQSPVSTQLDNWFYYVISNEANTIYGYHEGNKNEVEQYLKETLARLNQKFMASAYSYQHNVRKACEPNPYQ